MSVPHFRGRVWLLRPLVQEGRGPTLGRRGTASPARCSWSGEAGLTTAASAGKSAGPRGNYAQDQTEEWGAKCEAKIMMKGQWCLRYGSHTHIYIQYILYIWSTYKPVINGWILSPVHLFNTSPLLETLGLSTGSISWSRVGYDFISDQGISW